MTKPLSRRAMLRGAGTAIGLPLLEAMTPLRGRAGEAAVPPRRMANIYAPNGKVMWYWTPEAVGKLPEQLPRILQPFADLRDDFSIVSGLANDPGRAGVGHLPSFAAYLTCARPLQTQKNFRLGVSLDQVAAHQLGDRTRLATLPIGNFGPTQGNGEGGYALAYTSSLSWSDATTPVPAMWSHRVIFDRLFSTDGGQASGQRAFERRSILDFVRDEAGSLRGRLGGHDRHKLDEYFTVLRDIEERIERSSRMPVPAVPAGFDPPDQAPGKMNWAEHVRLLCDLLVVAFQTDSTRIATFQFGGEGSPANYPYAGITESHHYVSHHSQRKDDPNCGKTEPCAKINVHMAEQAAYLLRRLKETREGEGSLLDNCMIVYGSNMSHGGLHSKSNLPVLLAGRCGGALHPGRHVRVPEETPLANLWLTMLDHFGAKVERFGDSTGRIADL
ncbi:MAG: DUF1552 domain-containing protein [Planctomycetia bacterium]